MSATESLILRRIAQVQQNRLAESVGITTSQVSRIVAGQQGITLPHLGNFLQALDLEITGNDREEGIVTVASEEYEALKTLATKYLERAVAPPATPPQKATPRRPGFNPREIDSL